MAAVIDEARRRRRRRRLGLAGLAVLACAGVAIGLAVASSGGGGSRSASSPPRSASTRPRPFHPKWVRVQENKVVLVVAKDTGRVLRRWCAEGAQFGTAVWIARDHAFVRVSPAAPPPLCRS